MNPYSMGLMMFLAAAAMAGSLTPVVIQLAKRLGVLDRPAHRKATSKRIVPTLGGVAIAIGVWAALIAGSLLIPEIRQQLFVETQLGVMMAIVGGVMGLTGIIDDRFSMRPRTKLVIQVMLGLAMVGYGLSFERLSVPLLGTIELQRLAIPLTVIWFVGVTNALNLVDGIDGLASGVALVVSLTVAVIALMTGNIPALIVAAALAGACAGFLPYNFAPARIFLGDSGSLFLGASLAVLSLVSSTKAAVAGSMLVPVFLLGYPTLDTILVMSRRFLKGKPIFAGGRDHIHHRLLASGLNHGQSSLALYGFCAIFCLMAIGVSTPYDQATMVGGLVVVILIMILGSIHLGYFSEMAPQQVRRRRHEFLAVRYRFLLARTEMELAETSDGVLDAVRRISEDFGVNRLRIQMRNGGVTRRWVIAVNEHASAADVHTPGNGTRNGYANGHTNGHGHANGNGHTNGNGRDGSANGHGGGAAGALGGRLSLLAQDEIETTVEREPATDTTAAANIAHEGADGAGVIREKLRFPESRMTARVQLSSNGVNPDLKLEHRIYLSNALQIAGRRLAAIAERETSATVHEAEQAR